MEFRSKSCKNDRYFQIGSEYVAAGSRAIPNSMQELRSYSVNYATGAGADTVQREKELKIRKVKSTAHSSSSDFWGFSDPELQRKKRIAGYKVYSVEGKMKGSLRKSLKWIKSTCNHLVYRWS